MAINENTARYLFNELFIRKHAIKIIIYCFVTLIQNLAFISCVLSIITASGQSTPENINFDIQTIPEIIMVISASTYFLCYIYSFYLQQWLCNRFSINLNLNLDEVYDYAGIQLSNSITVSTVIKDVTYEFARFGTNLILPLLEIVKHLITVFIIVVFLAIGYPEIIVPTLALLIPYILFWFLSRNYFQSISVKISNSLADRQRFADNKYSDINLKPNKFEDSYVQKSFVNVINNIASYNVVSKTIASAPRVTLETIVLIAALVIGINGAQDEGMIYALGLSALRILPGMQGISGGISNIQLSWPAMDQYANRRATIKQWNIASQKHACQEFPSKIPICTLHSDPKNITFEVSKELDFTIPGLYLLKGESGIGKSTFLRIVSGLEPVLIDGYKWLPGRSNVMFMDQHEQLLTGTVKENFIDILDDKTSSMLEEMWNIFFDQDRFKTFDDFMNAELGTNSGLSGGEIKRLKLLRHLLSSEAVLIWDEPFDGIQLQLVKKLITHIRKRKLNRRIFIIDHNIVSSNEVDIIIKLKRGDNGLVGIKMENKNDTI